MVRNLTQWSEPPHNGQNPHTNGQNAHTKSQNPHRNGQIAHQNGRSRNGQSAHRNSKISLKMNLSKTKVMYNQHAAKKKILIHGETIGIINEYVYPEELKSTYAKLTDEINRKSKMNRKSSARLEDHILFSKANYQCVSRVKFIINVSYL